MQGPKIVRKVVGISLVLLTLALAGFAKADHTPLEVFPWPWGTECPFPWNTIEGSWSFSTKGAAGLIDFKIIRENDDGTVVFEVNQYNQESELIATGRGISNKDQRIVRAAVHPVGKGFGSAGYWVIVRTYPEVEELACVDSTQVTAMTFRPLDSCSRDHDVHYVINRLVKE